MASLKDYNNTNEDGAFRISWSPSSGSYAQQQLIGSQTFTPLENYELSSIRLALFRVAASGSTGDPGTIKCEVRNTDENGKPVGSVLVSSTTNGNTLREDAYEWREFTFSSNPNLTTGTKYAIVLTFFGSQISSQYRRVYWSDSPNQYDRGNALIAQNEDCPNYPPAEDWGDSILDFLFEVYGITADEITPFPQDRPNDYNPDDEWDPNGGEGGTGGWTSDPWDLASLGGGRYGKQLVVVGHRKIYFGEI